MASGLESIPNVDVSSTDYGVQLFNRIFGEGWQNLSSLIGGSPGGDAGVTFIYHLLGTLNILCGVGVVWIVIMTWIVGTVGAARDGSMGKYANLWVPVRMSFSFAAITPIFSGLNAMQILMLAAMGMSMGMANTAWEEGLDYISEYGVINSSVPPAVDYQGRVLASGALRSRGLMEYLAAQSYCGNWIEGEWKDTGDSIVYLFAVPRTCGASQNETNLQPGDLGGFKFPKSTIGTDIDVAKQKGIVSLLNAIQPPAERLGQKNFTYTDRARIFSAGHSYTTSVANALGAVVQQSDAKRREAFQSFAEVAKSSGWLTAGSYYWALSAINGRVVEAMEDNTEYMQPNMEAVRPLLHPDWLTYAEPNLQAATTTLLLADSKDSEHLQEGEASDRMQAAMGNDTTWGHVKGILSGLSEWPAKTMADFSSGGGNGDAVLTMSRAARQVMTAIEAAFVALSGAKGAVSATDKWDDSLWGKAAGVFTAGGSSAAIGAAKSIISDAMTAFTFLGGGLWTVFWFFAYGLPLIPFMIWVAAVVGWIVLSIEAIVAAPLWLISHAMPEGEGFAGMGARAGYALFFSLLFRPLLLILSLFVCMIVMSATGPLIGLLFRPFAESLRGISGNYGITGAVSLMIMLGTVIGLLTWKMFSMTTQIADRILRWIGQLIANLGDDNAQGMISEAYGSAQRGATKFAEAAGKSGILASVQGHVNKDDKKTMAQNIARRDAQNAQHMPEPVEKPNRINPSEV